MSQEDVHRLHNIQTHGNIILAWQRLAEAANAWPSTSTAASSKLQEAALLFAFQVLASESQQGEATEVLDDYVQSLQKARAARIEGMPEGYVNKDLLLIEKRCSCTMFDLKVRISKDGRERGLWVTLNDESEARVSAYRVWLKSAIDTFMQLVGYGGKLGDEATQKELSLRFSAELNARHEIGILLKDKVNEGALLEWPHIKELWVAMGNEIAKHEKQHGAIKTRNSRKPDRRGAKPDRRQKKHHQDDKTKARLKR